MTDSKQLVERLRAKIEAIPPRDRDWYVVRSPWLAKDMEPWIISGDMDPHNGMPVCNFDDAAIAGMDDQFSDDEWSDHNWAMAEFIEAADLNTVLSLIKEIAELRKLVKNAFNEGFSEGMSEFQKSRGGKGWQDSRACAKLEGSGE